MSSTEAPFSFTTKINGDLFTVRGVDAADFATNLEWAAEHTADIVERIATIQAGGNAASLVNTSAPSPTVPTPPAATAPVAGGWGPPASATPDGPLCEHGVPAKLIPAGISKSSGKPYRAFYACAQPRGSQCNFRATA